ncbi:MAG TPA: hypothetical protein VM686_03625 [Polyangiaceae bacterium]|nr:hypothetical protein [Polyangiaceae bacterium]
MEVTILEWDPGDQFMRWLAFAGKGEIVVEVDGAIMGVEGKARGWVTGGWFGGADENSADAVGRLIARTIATGKAWSVDAPERRQLNTLSRNFLDAGIVSRILAREH